MKDETLILQEDGREEIQVPLPLHVKKAQGQPIRHQAYVTFEATGLDWTGTRRTWMRRAPPRSRSLLVVEERPVRSPVDQPCFSLPHLLSERHMHAR